MTGIYLDDATFHGGPFDGRPVPDSHRRIVYGEQPYWVDAYSYRLERCTDRVWRWLGEDVQPVQLGLHYSAELAGKAWAVLEHRACELGLRILGHHQRARRPRAARCADGARLGAKVIARDTAREAKLRGASNCRENVKRAVFAVETSRDEQQAYIARRNVDIALDTYALALSALGPWRSTEVARG